MDSADRIGAIERPRTSPRSARVLGKGQPVKPGDAGTATAGAAEGLDAPDGALLDDVDVLEVEVEVEVEDLGNEIVPEVVLEVDEVDEEVDDGFVVVVAAPPRPRATTPSRWPPPRAARPASR